MGVWRDFKDYVVTRLPKINTMLAAEAKLLELTTEPGWWLRAEQGRVGRGTGVTANEGGEAVGGDRADEVMGASASQALDDWAGTGMQQQQRQGVYRACTEQQQCLARGSDSECEARARATTQQGGGKGLFWARSGRRLRARA